MKSSPFDKGVFHVYAAFFVVLICAVYTAPAHAYLDPGTGSIILQGLLAAVAAVVAAGGFYWRRVKSFFSSIFSTQKSNRPEVKDSRHNDTRG